jgi:hypothetical protein
MPQDAAITVAPKNLLFMLSPWWFLLFQAAFRVLAGAEYGGDAPTGESAISAGQASRFAMAWRCAEIGGGIMTPDRCIRVATDHRPPP